MTQPKQKQEWEKEHIKLYHNQWISLWKAVKPESGVNGYVYSNETRCQGKIVAILPYRKTELGYEYLLKNEMTPCWSFEKMLSSITGGFEGRDIRQDAVRELYEETGYKIKKENLITLGRSYASKSSDTVYTLFSVNLTGKLRGNAPGDGSRVESESEAVWVKDDVIKGCDDPQVSVMYLRLKDCLQKLISSQISLALKQERERIVREIEKRREETKRQNLFSYRESDKFRNGYNRAIDQVIYMIKEENEEG